VKYVYCELVTTQPVFPGPPNWLETFSVPYCPIALAPVASMMEVPASGMPVIRHVPPLLTAAAVAASGPET
jgi:hypothetical protein